MLALLEDDFSTLKFREDRWFKTSKIVSTSDETEKLQSNPTVVEDRKHQAVGDECRAANCQEESKEIGSETLGFIRELRGERQRWLG